MEKQSISASMAPQVIIETVLGDLEIKGWSEPQVMVEADPEDLTLDKGDDVVRLSCQGDLRVRVPHGATVQIESIHGDGSIRHIEDQVGIGDVHGSLDLRSVGATRVEAVHGQLEAKVITGNLEIAVIHGNASVRDVQGRCSLPEVNGNLDLRDVEDEVNVVVQGNARIRLSSMMSGNYAIQAEGNVHCNIPEDASLKLVLSSNAENIRVKLPDVTRAFQQESCELTVGAGEGTLTITAGGALYLFGQSADWAEREGDFASSFSGLPPDFSQRISQQVQEQVRAQMDMMTHQLDQQMERLSDMFGESGFSPEEIERIMAQARAVSERESERTQEKVRRAQEKLERKLEAARRRQEAKAQAAERREQMRSRRTWSFEIPTPPVPPMPEKEPVSEEERLMILRMLEQKKITLEEAEQLLSALEGKER